MTYRHVEGTAKARLSPAPSKAAGELIYMAWVPEDRIPPAHRRYVRRHVDRAAALAGLGPVRLRWFGPADASCADFTGIAPFADALPSGVAPDDQPMTVGINAGIRGDSLPAVIGHEVRHLVQRRDGLPSDEDDADRAGFAYLDLEAE